MTAMNETETARTATDRPAVSKAANVAGWVVGILPALMMILSAIMKFLAKPEMVKQFTDMGYNKTILLTLGVVELTAAIIYLIPRTSVLGAVLLTGYLGGATDANVRGGGLLFILPVALGVMFWLGLYLRDRRIRALMPLRD